MIFQTFNAYEKIKSFSVLSTNKIFLWGAGVQGQVIFIELKSLGINIDGFIDSSPDKYGSEYCGLPIYNSTVLAELPIGSYYVVCCVGNPSSYLKIRQHLQSLGLSEIEHFCDIGVPMDYKMQRNDDIFRQLLNYEQPYDARTKMLRNEKLENQYKKSCIDGYSVNTSIEQYHNYLGLLNFSITSYCSLSCNHCSQLIPYHNNKSHYVVKDIVNDLDRLLSVSYVSTLSILGGEPLLHPDLSELLKKISAMEYLERCDTVRIVTNGTMLFSAEQLNAFSKIRQRGVYIYVYISNYGSKSKQMNPLLNLCTQHSLPAYCQLDDDCWNDYGDFTFSSEYSERQLETLWSCCEMAVVCKQLTNGRLFNCPRIATMVDAELIGCDDNACIDIRSISDDALHDMVHQFVYETRSSKCCNYCRGLHPLFPDFILRGE